MAQAIRCLTRQAYSDASASLRETLVRDYFLDALPASDMLANLSNKAKVFEGGSYCRSRTRGLPGG